MKSMISLVLVSLAGAGILLTLLEYDSNQNGFLKSNNEELELEYILFLARYGKSYVTLEQMRHSKKEFMKTLMLIKDNSNNPNSRITLSLNYYSDIDLNSVKKTIY